MNLIKQIQHRVGVALTPAEHYERAFTQGVLLGPGSFSTAAELFERAAERAHKAGDDELARQARANALLYQFLGGGSPQVLSPLCEVLDSLQEVECVGSRVDRMRAAALRREVAGRLAECTIAVTNQAAHLARARLHHSASVFFHELGAQPLCTYTHRPDGLALARGDLRGFFHEGLARYHEALDQARRDPAAAADLMSSALVALQQTSAQAQQSEVGQWLERLRTQRSCWCCGREFAGAALHFHAISATVHEYVREVLRRAGEDLASVDPSRQTIVMCTTCSSAVNALADVQAQRRVAELRGEFERRMAAQEQEIAALQRRVAALAIRK